MKTKQIRISAYEMVYGMQVYTIKDFKLRNAGKQQIGVQSLFILGFASSDTKAVFEMVNGLFNRYSDFVGGIPFIRTADCARVGSQVFLG